MIGQPKDGEFMAYDKFHLLSDRQKRHARLWLSEHPTEALILPVFAIGGVAIAEQDVWEPEPCRLRIKTVCVSMDDVPPLPPQVHGGNNHPLNRLARGERL